MKTTVAAIATVTPSVAIVETAVGVGDSVGDRADGGATAAEVAGARSLLETIMPDGEGDRTTP